MREVINKIEAKARELLTGDSSGHDWYHVKQVRDMALRIAESEGGDKEIIEIAALAHDIGDWKFNDSEAAGEEVTRRVLIECGVSGDTLEHVMDIIRRASFKGAGSADDMPTLEGKIVQDADRLYALGAIGIARAFATGAKFNEVIHDPAIPPQTYDTEEQYVASKKKSGRTVINHFYEKLLLLKDRMQTKTGREIAEKRHAYMEAFLKQFMAEWDAKD